MFRDEIVETMKQLTELKASDLLSDEEFVGRIESLINDFRQARNFPKREEVIQPAPFVPSNAPIPTPLFAVTIKSPDGEQCFEFTAREITIGRSSESNIVLRRSDVSRRHARLLIRDGRFILLDLKSENGTYVNGERLRSPQVIHPNDQITIGDYQLFFEPRW